MQTEQSRLALKRAHEIRLHIAVLKKQLAAKTITINDVLVDEAVENLFLWDVFQWQPMVGIAYTRQMFSATRLPVTVRCGNLNERQLRLVREWVGARTYAARRAISAREHQRWTA